MRRLAEEDKRAAKKARNGDDVVLFIAVLLILLEYHTFTNSSSSVLVVTVASSDARQNCLMSLVPSGGMSLICYSLPIVQRLRKYKTYVTRNGTTKRNVVGLGDSRH